MTARTSAAFAATPYQKLAALGWSYERTERRHAVTKSHVVTYRVSNENGDTLATRHRLADAVRKAVHVARRAS